MTAAHDPRRSPRSGALTLALSGVLFGLFPLLRPWADKSETAAGYAEAMGSEWWVIAHLSGAFGFLLLALSLGALRELHTGTRGEAATRSSVVVTWLGTGLVLLFFGAETFALNAVALEGQAVFEISSAIREGATQLTLFALGLLLVAIGAVLVAMGVWRGGVLSRGSAILLAAAIALYLPQFFLPPAGRIAHGILTAAAALWLAAAMWRARRGR
ncbi:hypothetical protein [Microbacterium album]|uniref:DUF4386 family protein n=1 Tax=Microbacterium album TaxID=2053191 RepID=A0A917IFB4_9MICO|nr:hypothetical protein [Microbacterium album]GGH39892.1 hypothetical protein GCM10010921_11420 [Microbacterium album]